MNIRMTHLSLIGFLFFALSCSRSPDTFSGMKDDLPVGPTKPLAVPPSYDPNQFVVNSHFVVKSSRETKDPAGRWVPKFQECHDWIVAAVDSDFVSLAVIWHPICSSKTEKNWARLVRFASASGQVTLDQITHEGIKTTGPLQGDSIFQVFYSSSGRKVAFESVATHKIGQLNAPAFRVGDSLFLDMPETPLHGVILEKLIENSSSPKDRTISSVIEIYQ